VDRAGLGLLRHAGSFGFEVDRYDVSIRVGERVLLPAARGLGGDELLVTSRFSCREQVVQATGRMPTHTVELLRTAFNGG